MLGMEGCLIILKHNNMSDIFNLNNKSTRYWYFLDHEHSNRFNQKVIFRFEQLQNCNIKESDKIVLVDFKRFNSTAEVIKINKEENDFYKVYYIEVFIERYFEGLNQIIDYAYSLPKVYKHYNQPNRHFSRPYGRLTQYEYNTILNKDIFFSRTAFGRLINSIHIEHRYGFIIYLLRTDPELYLLNNDYSELFLELKKYINSHILSHVDILRETNAILKSFNNNDFGDFGFENPKNIRNPKLIISRQLDMFEDYDLFYKNWFVLEKAFQIQEDEKAKSKMFQNFKLPIDFKYYWS